MVTPANTHFFGNAIQSVHHHARSLFKQRHPRVDDDLFEQSYVLRRGVVVDVLDELAAEVCTEAAEKTVYQARGGDCSSAVYVETREKGMCSG